MKNTKKGFSLAEVLIATAIAAIIATIGFTIAKKGVARAYDLYVYAGYYGISQAVADASNKGYKIQECPVSTTMDINTCKFLNHIYTILAGRNGGASYRGAAFTTPNKIRYQVYLYNYRSPINTLDEIGVDINGTPLIPEYRIKMTVPSAKIGNSSSKTICFSYQPDSAYKNFLIPIVENNNKDPFCHDDNYIQDIDTRKDLLAFYLDDGYRGKKKAGVYQPRYFRSAKQAFCRVYGGNVKGSEYIGASGNDNRTPVNLINCNGLDNSIYQPFEVADPTKIIIRITDPRRI